MKIVDVFCSIGKTGFFFDDQRAIKNGAVHDGFTYVGECVTEGFKTIRMPGESISIILMLEDGQIAYGDCAAVQYSGAGGRDPLFLAKDFIEIINEYIVPKLADRELSSFKQHAKEFDEMKINGKRLHTAIRYGVTQAILDATAKAKKLTIAELVREEYDTGIEFRRIPIFAQSGDDLYDSVDRMIIKEIEVLPHALFNNVKEKLGLKGELLKEYVAWLRERVLRLRTNKEYFPILHLDVYGTIGLAFENDSERMANYIGELEKEAYPFKLRIEGPMDVENREEQCSSLKELRDTLKQKDIKVELVADEWCNTFEDIKLFADEKAADMIQIKTPDLGGVNNIIESILYCKKHGVGAYSGGTCNETDRSAQITTNIAIACGADMCLAKPGMGVDEGFMIVYNEMSRVLAIEEARKKKSIRW